MRWYNLDLRAGIFLRVDSGLFRDTACATLLAVEQPLIIIETPHHARFGRVNRFDHSQWVGRVAAEPAQERRNGMRKYLFILFTGMFALLSAVVAASVSARPIDSAPVQFPVDGTFSSAAGEPGAPFQGTVFVDSFVVQDGLLALNGTLVPPDDVSFAPLSVTLPATVRATDDAASGCTVQIDTAGTVIDSGFIVFLAGTGVTLAENTDPDSARELCRVVQTATKDPADQSALARALNRVLRNP